MKYVLAGNARQASQWAKESRLTRGEWSYLGSANAVRGLRWPDVVRVGTWAGRRDLREIEDQIAAANFGRAPAAPAEGGA